MNHNHNAPKIPMHKRRPPTSSENRFHAPRLPEIPEITFPGGNVVLNANPWLDQLTGFPAQAYTLCRLDNQLHILYLRLRRSCWQGYIITISDVGYGYTRSISHLLTDPNAVWTDDRIASLRLNFNQLSPARVAIIQAFLNANQIPTNRVVRFSRPRI